VTRGSLRRVANAAGIGEHQHSGAFMTLPSSSTPKTLPARYYTDPEVFRREMGTFFSRMWVCVGREEQVGKAGDYFLRDVDGESIIISCDQAGSVRAFYNVCRHRGTRMCRDQEGTFSNRIQCPYHGWTYALDGRLLGAPHMDESTFRHADYPLHAVHIDVWDGFIFIHLAEQPEPLTAQLADLPQKFEPWRMAELRLHRRISYDVKANWKLILLNYNECLHCPVLHPALSRVSDYMSGDNDAPHKNYVGGSMKFRGEARTMSFDGKLRRDCLPGLNEGQRRQVLYYAIYPNLFLSLHPDYVMTHTLWPRAVDRTEVICEWHFHPVEMAKSSFHGDDAVEFWDSTNREDWGISELSQAGIRSRAYTPGPYSPREGLLQALDRMVLLRERENGSG
jgi:Rieske 2Fe-2S family protein